MTFTQAIKAGFRNYVNFSSRASRSEYWYFVLFIALVFIVLSILDKSMDHISTDTASTPALVLLFAFALVEIIVGLGIILPSISIAVRRLHDLDKSGWWYLLNLVPLIGAIVLLVWYCMRGTVGNNRFGPDPLEGQVL
jgi:uncharacterized membrane protein YhaH (DUF805 family)